MSPNTLRTAFGIASLCTFGAIALLLLEPRGSGPFWISVWTLLFALGFLATVVWAIRYSVRFRKGGDASSKREFTKPSR